MKMPLVAGLLGMSLCILRAEPVLVVDLGSEDYLAKQNAVWRDRSGFGNDAKGYGENAPTLAHGATPTGRDALSFEVSQFLYLPNIWKGANMEKFSSAPDFSILAAVNVMPGNKGRTILGGRVGSLQYGISPNENAQSLSISSVKGLGRSESGTPNEEWTVVGVSYNGQTITYYENGQHVGTTDAVATFAIPPAEAPYYIGKSHAGLFFEGKIAAIRIYEGALGPNEMKSFCDQLVENYTRK